MRCPGKLKFLYEPDAVKTPREKKLAKVRAPPPRGRGVPRRPCRSMSRGGPQTRPWSSVKTLHEP